MFLETTDFVVDQASRDLAAFTSPPWSSLPNTTKHPWKIKIRKGYIPAGYKFDDPIDMELTICQIKDSVAHRDPLIPADQIAMVEEILSRGHHIMILQTASNWPFYFCRRFRCNEENYFSGKDLQLCLQSQSISILQLSEDSKHSAVNVLEKWGFDELVILETKSESVTIEVGDKVYKFGFKGKNIGEVTTNAIKESINALKSESQIAVAIAPFGPSDSGLVFEPGQLIQILERDSMNGWINGQVGGRQGYVNV